MKKIVSFGLLFAAGAGVAGPEQAKVIQFPSPMVEHTRSHPRLKDGPPAGKRIDLRIGTLFLPETLAKEKAPLLIHFHGGTRIPEIAASRARMAAIGVQLGTGSAAYARPFSDPGVFAKLVREAEEKSGRTFDTVALSAWSAGYGAVRAILKADENYDRVRVVLLLDGLHAGYVSGKPGPRESDLVPEDLAGFVKLTKDALAGKRQFVLVHTEIFPGTYASTTETADHLLKQVKLKRKAVLRWGPMGTQVLSEVKEGRFHLLGFAGNSAPDHIDVLHALPDLLGLVEWNLQE